MGASRDIGNYVVAWYWTDAWRCKCVSVGIQDPKILTDNSMWMSGKTVIGVYDIRKPLDMFRLGGDIEDDTDCWMKVLAVLESSGSIYGVK